MTESLSKAEKRKSIRNFFHLSIKSNAEKVEKYLYRCTLDPILKSSTLLRDFLSPQRDGDEKSITSSHAYPSPSQSYDQIGSLPTDMTSHNVIDSSIDIGKVWVPSPHPSVISLSSSRIDRSSSHRSRVSRRSSISRHSHVSRRSSISRHTTSRPNSIHRRSSLGRKSSISHHSPPHSIESSIKSEDGDDDLMNMLPKEQDVNEFEYDFPLENLEMIKVLGKGCMGKVSTLFKLIRKEVI